MTVPSLILRNRVRDFSACGGSSIMRCHDSRETWQTEHRRILSTGCVTRLHADVAATTRFRATGKDAQMIQHAQIRSSLLGVALIAAGVIAGCAAPPPPAPPMPAAAAELGATDGTVTFTGGAIAIGVGVQWGNGVLTFRGVQYPFRLSGMSIVDVGVTRVTGSGTVHNLRNAADFSGNYVSVSAGAALAGGGAVATLRNQNGVVIDGIATTQGVRLTLAPGGVNITLTSP
jgi:hypothetical protein